MGIGYRLVCTHGTGGTLRCGRPLHVGAGRNIISIPLEASAYLVTILSGSAEPSPGKEIADEIATAEP